MKPNDTIKVKSDLKVNKRYGDMTFTRPMEKYLGKRVTLEEQITTNGVWAIKETNLVAWDESMFDMCTLEKKHSLMEELEAIKKRLEKLECVK